MKKSFFTLFLILISISLFPKVIATVGDLKITTEELQDKIQQNSDSLSVSNKRIAFNHLLNDYLFLYYAKQNGITVSERELDDYFISQLGDDPTLQTNGAFDYNKYLKLKETDKGKKILDLMKRDILIRKSKYIVMNDFDLDDDTLLKKFISDNLDVDISYGIFDIESLDLHGDCNYSDALNYYNEHKMEFMSPPSKVLEFSVHFFKDYTKLAETLSEKKIEVLNDSLYTFSQIDSMKNKIYSNIVDSLTYQSAVKDYKYFRSSMEDSIRVFETYPIDENTTFDKFPTKIIQNMELEDVALPFKTDYGYVTAKVIKIIPPKILPLEKVATKVWKIYLQKCNFNEDKVYKFYSAHPDSFMTNASFIELLKLHRNIKKISKIQEDFFNENLNKYKGNIEKRIVFLDRFANKDSVSAMIASKIRNNMERGVIGFGDYYYIFKQIVHFPNYIPKFNEIKRQLKNIDKATLIDTAKIRKYYEENKRNMVSPDSVKLGFAYFPFVIDTLQVTDEEMKDYYIKNRDKFHRKGASLTVDYIAFPDSITAKKVKSYLDNGIDFNRLKLLYNIRDIKLFDNELIIKTLPDTLKNILDNTPLRSYSEPIFYQNDWLILYKKKYNNRSTIAFEEVKDNIARILKLRKAKKIAYQNAKTVFDSTRYFADCKRFVPKENILISKFQQLDEKFDKLGDMTPYKDELMRIWRNVKLTSIVEADSGYAVVYLLKKKYSKKLKFEEAKPKIIKILIEDNKLRNAQKHAKLIRSEIIAGKNPDSLLFFLGGWKKVKHLKLNSIIPGMSKKMSALILNDIGNHQSGYVSPVLKLNLSQLAIYKIDNIKKVSVKDFYKRKNKIKAKIIAERMKEWLEDYKKTVPIKLYGF